jgi:hypothetical protein
MNQKDGYMIFRPVASTIVALAAAGLMYVWLDCSCQMVGKEIQKLEREKAELVKKQSSEQFRWTQMKAPRNVEQVMRQHNMKMDWPSSVQVVHLSATPRQPDEPDYTAWSMQFASMDMTGGHD